MFYTLHAAGGFGALFTLAMVLINMPHATAVAGNGCDANIHEKCGGNNFYMCKGNVEVCVANIDTRTYRAKGYSCGKCAPVPFQQGNTFPATGGQTANLFPQGNARTPANVVCGSIQAVLAHPTNADICFAGATNGGVWRTTSCRASAPVWKPLTDFVDSLSVADMVFDTKDATANTVVVAVGRRSSFNEAGGIGIGLLYSKNALAPIPTWRVLDINAGGANSFRANDVQFRSLFVRRNLILAAAFKAAGPFNCANIGVFRSTDGGSSWTNVLRGVALAIAADPNDLNRFYATIDSTFRCGSSAVANGVFTSIDMGATWTTTSPINPAIAEGKLAGAKLSVSAYKSGVGSSSRVWSGLVENRVENRVVDGKNVAVNVSVVAAIAYSDNNGRTWTTMDQVDNLTKSGNAHFSMLASPNNKNEVYVGGAAQPLPSIIGAIGYTGRLFRGDASVQGGGQKPSLQWEHMTDSNAVPQIPQGGTAGSSGPHADSRDMEFRADGSILEGDDGGITMRSNPGNNTGDWFGLCGNMQAFETHSIAYEPIRKMVLFGSQDTGTIAGVLGQSGTYRSLFGGDGNACMIDYTTDPDLLFFYYGSQKYRFFLRQAYSRANGMIQGVTAGLTLPAIAGFLSIVAMNPANQREFVVALAEDNKSIAFTNNRGNTFSRIGAIAPGAITSMTWSGVGNTLFIASFNGGTSSISRCSGCCLSARVCNAGVAVPGSAYVFRLAVDPQNNNVVFAVSVRGALDFRFPKLFSSVNGGASWKDISVSGSLLSTASLGASVTVIAKNTVNAVAVGTSNGVLVPNGRVGVGWKLLAPGLPKVAVLQMVYEPTDDTLIVALLRRGVWFLRQASKVVSGTAGSFVGGAEKGDDVGLQLVPVTNEWNNTMPPEPLVANDD